MPESPETLSSRREFLFCYDIKMGNPNGDPDENRPRVLPDKTHYVTDVRLKRFVRDYLKTQGKSILVDSIEGRTTNLTGRVAAYLAAKSIREVSQPDKLVEILLDEFIDARLFGNTFAFKAGEKDPTDKKSKGKKRDSAVGDIEPDNDGGAETDEKGGGKKIISKVEVEGKPQLISWRQPKTLTGATQIQMGEVKHAAEEVDINGTSSFGSDEDKTRGTFTTYYALRYALIAFNGVANQHSAKKSRMTDADYDTLLNAMWYGVRSAGNTRTKRGQVPRLLISVVYKPGEEFQFGNLMDYLQLKAVDGKQPKEWASPDDYTFDIDRLVERLKPQAPRIKRVEFCVSPDVQLSQPFGAIDLPGVAMVDLKLDTPVAKVG